jgi:hypothetical protein
MPQLFIRLMIANRLVHHWCCSAIVNCMNPEQIEQLVRERGPYAFDRMFAMLVKVRERLDRVCVALDTANVPYAVIGGNAVAAWVATTR